MLVSKTEAGQRVLKDRSVALTPRQRSVLIMFDGKRTVDQVLQATAAAGVTQEDVDKLLELGLVAASGGEAGAPAIGTGAAQPGGGLAASASASPQPGAPAAISEPATGASATGTAQPSQRTPSERYAQAYPIATALTAGMGLRGFRLNLAVEGARSFEDLLAIAPRIRDAVGEEKFRPLDQALNG